MADFIYNAEGRPQAFRLSDYIYAMDGTPIGRVWAEKAYKLSGEYVGALVNNMVVDKPGLSRRSLPPQRRPEPAAPPITAEGRRATAGSFPDVFDQLLQVDAGADPQR